MLEERKVLLQTSFNNEDPSSREDRSEGSIEQIEEGLDELDGLSLITTHDDARDNNPRSDEPLGSINVRKKTRVEY